MKIPNYKLSRPSSWMFPTVLVGIMLCTAPVLNMIFNAQTRWGFLFLGLLWLSHQKRLWLVFRTRLNWGMILLLLWPFLTVLWSLSPIQSLIKVVGFIAVACSMFAFGAVWSLNQKGRALDALLPLFFAFVLLILVLGLPTKVSSGYGSLYEGAGNPNLTGFIAAASTPVIFFRLFGLRKGRLFWWGALAFIVYILLATLSRSSIMIVGITALGVLIGVGAKKRLFLCFGAPLVALMIVAAVPNGLTSVTNYLYSALIMKGALEHSDIDDSFLASRHVPFDEQMRAAKAGGVFGGGYGAQIEVGHYIIVNGQRIYFAPGTYKREKGNSILAVAEEQGLVGVGITITWLYLFLRLLFRSYRIVPPGSERLQMAVLIAFLIGMVTHMMFEAWWVSPGSLEAVLFWGVAGMAYGLGMRHRNLVRAAHSARNVAISEHGRADLQIG